MQIKLFQKLPKEAVAVRTKVFMKEQGFVDEYDQADAAAMHLVAFVDGKPVGTCRFFWDEERNAYVVGRLAALLEYRGKKIGAALLREAERQIGLLGGKSVHLHAQCRAGGFYEKQGYQKMGRVELDEGCPHVWMVKAL